MTKPGNRLSRREIAESTLKHLDTGTYSWKDTSYDLNPSISYLKEHTAYYASDSEVLSSWQTSQPESKVSSVTKLQILEISTLQGLRQLHHAKTSPNRVAVLNFASAKHEGGGFKSGAQAQEESLARSSTLYPSLMTDTAQKFYRQHRKDPKEGYYSHSMIFSPRVTFFRDDDGGYVEPVEADIVVSCAVNSGVARRKSTEQQIESAMKERMGRILFLCETQGSKDLVLGSFGTGVFRNKVDMVARVWKELLVDEGARFKDSFENVVFAILGSDTFRTFKETFGGS